MILDDEATVESGLVEAAHAANTTPLRTVTHRFAPHGVTGVVIIAESHLSIHTWPEAGYASVDFFTCGKSDPLPAKDVLLSRLQATHCEWVEIKRGLDPQGKRAMSSMQWTTPHIEYAADPTAK